MVPKVGKAALRKLESLRSHEFEAAAVMMDLDLQEDEEVLLVTVSAAVLSVDFDCREDLRWPAVAAGLYLGYLGVQAGLEMR